jgi:AcrR family transcriptional regulator
MTTRSRGHDPARASRRFRRPPDRRDRIIATAARLFRQNGFHATGIDEIASEEEVSGTALYRHFANKEALLVACAEEGLARVNEAFAGVHSDLEPEARLRALIAAGARVTVEHLDEMVVYVRERRHLTATHRSDLRKRARENTDVLLDALLTVRPELSRVHGVFALQSLNGIYLSIANESTTLSQPRTASLLSDMGSAAVLAPVDSVINQAHYRRPTDDHAGIGRVSRREQILADSMRLFRQHGYASVGMGQIGEASGLKGSSLYRHYSSKSDVLAAGISRIHELLAASMSDALSAPTAEQAMQRLVIASAGLAVQHRELLAVELSEGAHLDNDARLRAVRYRREHTAEWTRLLRVIDDGASAAEARAIAGAVLGVVVGFVQGTLDPEPSAARSALRSMMFAALDAPRAQRQRRAQS